MTIETRWTTVEELLRMPDDGFRYELVRGELKKMPPAGDEHGYIAGEVFAELRNHVKAGNLGRTYAAETGFVISRNPDTVLAPDAAFVNRERVEEVGQTGGYFPGAPDLAVEVLSPNDTHTEVTEKALAWLDAGSRLVLVADPRRRAVTVYRSRSDIRILTAEAGDRIDGADVVPGWILPVAELFVG
ncbi:MAG: Uma2 family endonuclease [Actinomycetota bacterium]|nr:Uma2 family endonuclease [Actinomycetota bacterium]